MVPWAWRCANQAHHYAAMVAFTVELPSISLYNSANRFPRHTYISFLALLDCVSRANAVARGAVVRPSVKRVFSETVKQIDAKFCGKVAIHHISRPFFPFFKILNFWILTIVFGFVNYGRESFKTLLLPQLWFFFNQTFSEWSLWQSSQELPIWDFDISNLNWKQILKFNIVSNKKMTKYQYLGINQCNCLKMVRHSTIGGRGAKRNEIWDLGRLATHIWSTFSLIMFKIILGWPVQLGDLTF